MTAHRLSLPFKLRHAGCLTGSSGHAPRGLAGTERASGLIGQGDGAGTGAIAATLKQTSLSPEQSRQAEAELASALEVSPREEETLRLGALLYKREANDSKLAEILDALAQVTPDEAGVFEDLGHARYRMRDWDGADRALLRARELKSTPAIETRIGK